MLEQILFNNTPLILNYHVFTEFGKWNIFFPSFFHIMNHITRLLLLQIETFPNSYLNLHTNFHDRIPDESSRGIDKGYHRGNPLYRFLWNAQLVMPAFVCRGSSRILSPAIKPRYKSKGYECNDTSGTKGSSYLASRACTRVSRVCVYIGWFKKILHKMKDLYTEKKKYR